MHAEMAANIVIKVYLPNTVQKGYFLDYLTLLGEPFQGQYICPYTIN
jgi:hypothetical protein